MNNKCLFDKKIILMSIVIYFLLAFIFYYAANDKICYTERYYNVNEHDGYLEDFSDGTVVTQNLEFDVDYVYEIGISVATFMRTNTGNVVICLEDTNGKKIAQRRIKAESILDNSIEKLKIKKHVERDTYVLKIISEGAEKDASITLYRNSEINCMGKGYYVNGVEYAGSLKLSIYGGITKKISYMYWPIVVLLAITLLIVMLYTKHLECNGDTNWLLSFLNSVSKYRFLIKQLVERDFKSRYKRSVLGVCWSLLNPILMMMVQYIVFSTIFRSDIDNFPLYLLCGSVLFTFFTDSAGNGLTSIVGNASLITKVYVPKYVYPVSKVLSTAINLILSMIPLLIVVLVTKAPITKTYLLIPFVLICLILFCIGVSFLLSSAMVFFRDTQFLWGVVTILWMYATPLFYPETIIPEHFRFVLNLNPMYHYVSFLRMIMLKGSSPYLYEYVYCLGFSILALVCGIFVYKKTENKFILFI